MQEDEKEKTALELLGEWHKHVEAIESLEARLQEMREMDDPCLICMEAIAMVISTNHVLKDSMDSIAEQISTGGADLEGMTFMMNLYNQWHTIASACVMRMAHAGHREIEAAQVVRADGCIKETFDRTITDS
jgi:hypothetical protein